MARRLKGLAAGLLMILAAPMAGAQERANVVAVNYALQYMAEQLLMGDGDAQFPVPDGVDPSYWRPAISDISAIQVADLILLNGAGFATWVDRVSLPRSRLVTTSADLVDQFIKTETITHSHGDGGEHSHEGVASYLWLDPSLGAAQAGAVAEAMKARGLVPESDVAARLEALTAEFEAIDAEARAALADADDLVLIATHPRYQYLARAYGLTILSLEWEAGALPSPEDLAELQALLATNAASILIWEAAPPEDGLAATAAMGLQNVIFPPLATRPANGTFVESFKASISALAEAVTLSQAN